MSRRARTLWTVAAIGAALAGTATSAVHAAGPTPRIVNGTYAPAGSAPFTLALMEAGGVPALDAFCGGVLVKQAVVLTAAHCVEGVRPEDLEVALPYDVPSSGAMNDHGSVRLAAVRDNSTQIAVTGIAVHPQYDAETLNNDLALLRLPAPLARPAAPPVAPGGSAEGDAWKRLWEEGQSQQVFGFGSYDETLTMSQDLKQGWPERYPDTSCAAAYGAEFVPATMLCAINRRFGDDACLGDSGGPLAVSRQVGAQTEWRTVGIVSWGAGCGDPDAPTVYARLGGYLYGFATSEPGGGGAAYQPSWTSAPTLSRVGDELRCTRGTWTGDPTDWRYAIVPADAVETAVTGPAATRAVTVQDSGRSLVCVVEALRAGAGGLGRAVSAPLTIGVVEPPAVDPPLPPVTPPGTDPVVDPRAPSTGGTPTGGIAGGAANRDGGVRGSDVNRDAPRSPLTLSATRDCSAGRCRIELRAKPAKGKAVTAVRAKVATCMDKPCTKRTTRTYALTRRKDGSYVLRVTLKPGKHLLDVSSKGRSGGWQQPVRRTLSVARS